MRNMICLGVIGVVLFLSASPAYAQSADDLKVTPELDRVVERGLDYLAKTQKPDGSWPDNYGQLSGVAGHPVGLTGRQLAFGEHIANPPVRIVEVVTHPQLGHLQRERDHISNLAHLGALELVCTHPLRKVP